MIREKTIRKVEKQLKTKMFQSLIHISRKTNVDYNTLLRLMQRFKAENNIEEIKTNSGKCYRWTD